VRILYHYETFFKGPGASGILYAQRINVSESERNIYQNYYNDNNYERLIRKHHLQIVSKPLPVPMARTALILSP